MINGENGLKDMSDELLDFNTIYLFVIIPLWTTTNQNTQR